MRYIRKPVVWRCALAGNLAMIPAADMLIDLAERGTPVMGDTVGDADSNVILNFMGPDIVSTIQGP